MTIVVYSLLRVAKINQYMAISLNVKLCYLSHCLLYIITNKPETQYVHTFCKTPTVTIISGTSIITFTNFTVNHSKNCIVWFLEDEKTFQLRVNRIMPSAAALNEP